MKEEMKTDAIPCLLLPWSVKLLSNSIQEFFGVQIHAFLDIWQTMNAASQIFGHFSRLNCVDTSFLECKGKSFQIGVIVEFCTVFESSGPCEDRSNWICRCWLSLLMETVMTCDSSMCCFSFDRLAIGTHQHWGHQTERSVAWDENFTFKNLL